MVGEVVGEMVGEVSEATVRSPRPDRGQAALLVVVTATVLLAVMAWGLAATGWTVVDRTRARTAADAAGWL